MVTITSQTYDAYQGHEYYNGKRKESNKSICVDVWVTILEQFD